MTGGENKRFQEPTDVATQFLRSKLAPVPSYVWDAGAGKDFKGDRFERLGHLRDEKGNFNPGGGVIDRLAPMVSQDALEAFSLEGATGLGKLIPGFFGIGVQMYEKKSREKDK